MAQARLPEDLTVGESELRLLRDADAAVLGAVIAKNIDHLGPWMPWIADEPVEIEDRIALITKWTEAWEAGGTAFYGIYNDGELVGGCRLTPGVESDGLEIGYWLSKDHLGKGLATEAAAALRDVALATPGINWVEIRHDKANEESARIAERLGFKFVGNQETELEAPGEEGLELIWRDAGVSSEASTGTKPA